MTPPRVRVTVPATSANLGPGFDTLGLALDWHDVVEAEAEFATGDRGPAGPRSVTVKVDGVGAGEVPNDESHLVVRSMRAYFDEVGVDATRIELSCQNRIPHGRGLGSSAGAIVAGLLAARALSPGRPLDDDAVLALAARIEGHPDNVAPCLLGGLTIAWTDETARAVRTEVHAGVVPVVCVPQTAVSTEVARTLLPESVPHTDAARNAGRAALLVEALTRRPDLLLPATDDHLHQSYREPAMPATLALVSELRKAGHAAVVSGAGPSVLVLGRDDQPGLADVIAAAAPGWLVEQTAVDTRGSQAELIRPAGGPVG